MPAGRHVRSWQAVPGAGIHVPGVARTMPVFARGWEAMSILVRKRDVIDLVTQVAVSSTSVGL
jgi:hypothetical protein